MTKASLVKNRDQFIVRLPDGMRERIKTKADRAGMSMNEAIVWCLDQYFPAPATFDEKVDQLVEMVAMLKDEAGHHKGVDSLIDTIDRTLREVASGRVETPRDFRGEVADQLERYDGRRAEDWRDAHENPFEDKGGDLDEEVPF